MTRHHWKDNTCTRCGIHRQRRTWKLLMAIVGSRDMYQYGTAMSYNVNGKWTFKRPECVQVSQETIVANYYKSNIDSISNQV